MFVLGYEPQFCKEFWVWDTTMCCSAVLVCSFWGFRFGKQSDNDSFPGNIVKITVSTGLINLDCFGVTAENSALCIYFFIKYGESVVLVTLTDSFLSIFVDIELEFSKFAVSINCSRGVTVPVVFHVHDVARLVAAEHVLNKYSHLKSRSIVCSYY